MAKNNGCDRGKDAIPMDFARPAAIPPTAVNSALRDAVEARADPALLNSLLNSFEVPGAAEAIARYTELSKASHPPSKRLSELIAHLTLPEAMPLMSRIKPPPPKMPNPGRPPGKSQRIVAIEEKARANLIESGIELKQMKIAREMARLQGKSGPGEINTIRSWLSRYGKSVANKRP